MAASASDDFDLGALWRRLLRRWWIVLLALLIGATAGYLHVRGSQRTVEGQAVVQLGQPLTLAGTPVGGGAGATAQTAAIIAAAPEVLQTAESAAGLSAGALSGGRVTVTQQSAQTTPGKTVTTPIVQVTVRGPFSTREAGMAADSVAQQVAEKTNGYQAKKKAIVQAESVRLTAQIAELERAAATAQAQSSAIAKDTSLSATERAAQQVPLLLAQSEASGAVPGLQDQLSQYQLTLATIDTVENSRVIASGRGAYVDGTARWTSIFAGALLGLVIGAVIALALPERRRASA